MEQYYKAEDICGLLTNRHMSDLTLEELMLPNGMRMDFFAMSSPHSMYHSLTGYEIKVTRSDWLNDMKYKDYVQYCNYFYIVAAPRCVLPEEVPPNMGFIEMTSTKSRLFTKRKAPAFDVKNLRILTYIIWTLTGKFQWRAGDRNKLVTNFEDYVKGKKHLHELGVSAAYKIRHDLKTFEDRKTQLEQDRRDIKELVSLKEYLEYTFPDVLKSWQKGDRSYAATLIQEAIKKEEEYAKNNFTIGIEHSIDTAIHSLQNLKSKLGNKDNTSVE